MTPVFGIAPHGGRLIDRMVTGAERDALLAKLDSMPKLQLNARETADVDMIAVGAMSPLEGFMGEADYKSVCEQARLASGLPWGVPVVVALKEGDDPSKYEAGTDIALVSDEGQTIAVLHSTGTFAMDKGDEARKVLKTDDEAHPGVQYLQKIGDRYVGGQISVLERVRHDKFGQYRLDPIDTRVLFAHKGWKSVVAFQTRNPIHRAHEYLTKVALEICEGLMIHPLVGETKGDDIPADVRVRCYETLLERYYPQDRTVLAVYPQAMRYGGPREALLHATVRKNYGVTHIIIGRDHAGVGSYYGTYDGQQIFDQFKPEEIGITPLRFEHSFWCKKVGGMATDKTSNSGKEDRIFLSGTQVRSMLRDGVSPPEEFTRPEVAQILIDAMKAQPA